MRQMKLSEVILDFTLYPRTQIDGNHVRYLLLSHEGGAKLPPIVIDKKSKRVADGFHRVSMMKRLDPTGIIEAIEKNYKDDAELFADAIRLNAHHGRNLSPYDRTHCVLRGEELGLDVDAIAAALSITVEAVGELRADRVGEMRVAGKKVEVPLKRTINHKAGSVLTQRQVQANDRLGGMNQLFYVNQLIELIEAELLDRSNERLMGRLEHLAEILDSVVRTAKA